jgi:formate dehydrogenase subunit delta
MNIEPLIKMANEIASFFEGDPDKEQAKQNAANHMSRYWERRMRHEIVAHYHRGAGGLGDIARGAVAILAQQGSHGPPPPSPGASDAG